MSFASSGDSRQHYHLFHTAVGLCGVAWSAAGVTRVQLPEADDQATEARLAPVGERVDGDLPPAIAALVDALVRYFAGEEIDFSDVAVDLGGAPDFQRRVYEALRHVGWGETTTYGALARLVGRPDAAQAVGQAMARNPAPIVIPCHRVLASGNKIGGFSAYGGAIAKTRLLDLEGIRLGAMPGQGELPFG